MKRYAEYKDSGIPWIGEIPKDWEINKIKYCTYVKGRIGWQGLKADEFIDEGPFLVTGTDLVDGEIVWDTCYHISLERYNEAPQIQLINDDLLITKDGTIGKIAIVKDIPDKAILNSGLFVIRPLKNQYLTKFMFWLLSSKVFWSYFGYLETGSTIKHLYQETFVNFTFPFPQISIQQAVSDYLDQKITNIDTLIADKQKLIDLLKEKRQSIISEAVTKGLDKNVPMKDSGIEWIGDIPEDWKISKIKYELQNYDNKRKPINSIERGNIMGIYDYYGASGIIDKINDYIFDETLILIGEDGANLLTRRLPLIYIATGKYWVNNHAHILKPLLENNLYYFAYQLELIDLVNYITGSAQPKLTQERLGIISVVVPPINIQKNIIDFLGEKTSVVDSLISDIELQIEKLKEYRQAVISEAVTGKVAV